MKLTVAAVLSCCLLLKQPVHAESKPYLTFTTTGHNEEDPKDKKPAKKTKVKATKLASRNNDAVKIYPDIIKREMHVVAKDNNGREITFFVFDVLGNLVQQYKMKAKDHYRMTGLKKGTYIYRIFSGDEETATGKFDIR